MKTVTGSDERARWLLEFAYLDLDALREGDWVNLRADLMAFSGEDVVFRDGVPRLTPRQFVDTAPDTLLMVAGNASKFMERAPREWFAQLQSSVRNLVWQSFGPGFRNQIRSQPIAFPRYGGLLGHRTIALFGDLEDPGEGAESEILLIGLFAFGRMSDVSRIQLCPECNDRFFWRVKRQRFCSEKCRNRVNYHNWLVRQGRKK